MSKVTLLQNYLQLIHNINFHQDETEKEALINLLVQSDIDLNETNILKNESISVISENLKGKSLLIEKLIDANSNTAEIKKFKVFRRETPFRSARISGSLPAWARAVKPAFSLGPFSAADGRQFWFDFFRYTKLMSVFLGSDPDPIMLITLKIPLVPYVQNNFEVVEGSVWIRADLLANGVNRKFYTGLNTKGGKIRIDTALTIAKDKLHLASGAIFSLQLNLDNTFKHNGNSIYGKDAKDATVILPESIEFNFTANKMSIKKLEPGRWDLYGKERDFNWDHNQPITFNNYLQRIVVPLLKGDPECIIENCQSKFIDIEGTAPVLSSGWCLSVNLLDINKPFEVIGNGVFALLCSKGFSCKWKGLHEDAFSVQLKFPLIMASPGKISLSDLFPDFHSIGEKYQLWKRTKEDTIRTSAELFFRDNKPLNYYCDEIGYEAISTLADCNFETDKPYRADGKSVSPESIDTFYLKYITDKNTVVFLYDADMILEINAGFKNLKKPVLYQFAISNAYLLTTPPASLMLAGIVEKNNIVNKAQLNIAYGLFNLTPTLPDPYTSNVRMELFGISTERLKEIKDVKEWFPLLQNYLMSKCTWEDGVDSIQGTVQVDFELLTELFRKLNNLPTGVAIDNQQLANLMQEDIIEDFSLMDGIINNDIYGRSLFSLLDVSSNCDFFGVSMVWNSKNFRSVSKSKISFIADNIVTIDNMSLQAPMVLLNGFTLPHISWEPLNNIAKHPSGDATEPFLPLDPPKGLLSFPDNGPPTVFSQLDISKTIIDPIKFMEKFKQNIHDKPKLALSYVIFGLPHGKVALSVLQHFNEKFATVNKNFDFNQPDFILNKEKIKGGMQFRICASIESGRPKMPGVTNQLRNVADRFGNILNKSILGDSVHFIFQSDFFQDFTTTKKIIADGVPITHIDFSGYGASMFSDWHNPNAQIAQVTQAKFDVLNGRVTHEIVQVATILHCCGAKVVRTITFYRNNNAIIYREDSGWIAISDGTYDFSFKGTNFATNTEKQFDNPYVFHPGIVNGWYKIQNIKETGEPDVVIEYILLPGDFDFVDKKIDAIPNKIGQKRTAVLRAVTFDANVSIADVSEGASTGKVSDDPTAPQLTVTGKKFKGYLQMAPSGVPIPARVLKELLQQQQNSLGGTVDCTIKLGGSAQTIKVSRVDVSASFQNNDHGNIIFISAARGSVQLPAEGSWSIVEVDKKTGEVTPVTNKLSIPVIRKGVRNRNGSLFNIIGADGISKITFPDALLNNEASFAKRYGFIQNTGTQKLLLTDPRYDKINPLQLLTEAPLLADAYRLLNSKGPFCNIKNAMQIENVINAVTDIIPKGLAKTIKNFKVPNNLQFDILGKDNEPLHMYIKYESKPGSAAVIDYVTDSATGDPSQKWKNEISNMSVVVDLGPFKKLMTISGDFKSKSSIQASFATGNAPQLKLCKELQPIYDILEFLDSLDPTKPAEAIKKGLKIAMSNAADSWEYKFKAEKEIPLVKFPFDSINYNSPTTPLKLDAYFRIGCYFNQPIKIPNTVDELMPSAGAYIELGATLRVMCFSLAAATIYAVGKAEVGLAADIKSGPNLYFKFGFGVEIAVGLPVIGDVAVMYLVGVDMKLTTEDLTVGAFLYFRGRAEIFCGIVTVTIQIEAAGKIHKKLAGGPTDCVAMCTFALDISIFFIIDICFTETWEESRQIA